jgi:hypothetical protein
VYISCQDDFIAPWYYHGLDGPKFTNKTIDGIEVRSYGPAYWASTKVEGYDLTSATSTGFNRLFDYISGANSKSVKIDMTTPVLVKVLPGSGPNCNTTFTVSFFVPYFYQLYGPPAPTNTDVFLEAIGPLNVAVSEFAGFAEQKEIIGKAAALEEEVNESDDLVLDQSVQEGTWYSASYDPPFRLTNRHNEVFASVVNK